MKKILVLLVGASLLASCTDLFDTNYFAALDVPPAVTAATFDNVSSDQLATMADNPAFYTQLKGSPEALAAVKATLESDFTNPDAGIATQAARTYINIVANATETIGIVGNFVTAVLPEVATISTISGDPEALQALGAGLFTDANGDPLSAEDTKAALLSMLDINSAFSSLSTVSDADNPFFADGDKNTGTLAQIGLVAGAMTALLSGTGEDLTSPEGKALAVESVLELLTATDPAAVLASNFNMTLLGENFANLAGSLTGGTTTNSDFAYMSNLSDIVPISF